jgi:rhamnose utilization protein RhaD (predicted bifunctional aldolase and dehydrogenase)
MPKNVWNESDAPKPMVSRTARRCSAVVENWSGNTSTKSLETDHVGLEVTVLWVRGSGSDIADISERGFTGLKLKEVLPLFDCSSMTDQEMTGYLDRTGIAIV